jgi:LCP family protein required for cell wall assembly
MTARDPRGRRVIGRSDEDGPDSVTIGGPGPHAAPRADPPVSPTPNAPWNEPPSRAPARPVLGSSGGGTLPPPPRTSGRAPSIAADASSIRRRRFHRPRLRTVLVIILALVVLAPIGAFAVGWWQYSRIPTVNVASVLSARGGRHGTNYLVVGTDSRAGISAADPNAGAFLSGEVSGSRTDTIMVLHVEGGTTQLASIPRDLWVTDPATGQKGRINSTFASGPANLVKAVEQIGIPVDHYLEINFVSFAKLVDAVGGITIDFPNPARDDHSGLSIDKAGPNHLNGTQALAYVRSRYYTELIDGKWRTDGTADIGRTERQRAFLTALMHQITSTRNPIALMRIPGALGSGLKRDTTLSYLDALDLAWTMKDAKPQPVALPVTPRPTSGGADVLDLRSDATTVISGLAH